MKRFLFLFILLFLPVSVFAADYTVENFLVDATVLENGDMNVKELIVLDGTFNGYIRDITYQNSILKFHTPIDFSQDAIYNATGISNVQIKAKTISDSVSFDTISLFCSQIPLLQM